MHRLIRTGRSLFTAHTNADSASPGVSDALAHAVGLTVDAVLDPVPGAADLDKWVIYVPRENSEAVRAAVFEAGAGHIGDYSHCSWSVAGTGQFLAHDGASPAIGSVGTVERVAEDRVEVVAPARARAEVLAAMRAAHPYEEPAFDIFALVPPPVGSGLGRIGRLPNPNRCAPLLPVWRPRCRRLRPVCAPPGIPTCWCRGSRSAAAPGTRCLPPWPPRTCKRTLRPICDIIQPTSIAELRKWP